MEAKDLQVGEVEIPYQVKKGETFTFFFWMQRTEFGWRISEQEQIGWEKHWVKCLMWNFEKMVQFRKRVFVYDEERRTQYYDLEMLEEVKIRNLLQDWSFSSLHDGMRLIHVNGFLSDESWRVWGNLYPGVSRFILRKMNEILEGEG